MSSTQNQAYEGALGTINQLQSQYTGLGLGGMNAQLQAINTGFAAGEPGYMKQAYAGQRTNLTQGLAAQGGAAQAQQMRGSKSAMAGGNAFASLNPADVGSQLANALYGSKFQEGQANINQQYNLMNMGLGGSGTAANAGLTATGNQLGAIAGLPNYNTTLANVAGAASGVASLYGAYQSWLAGQPGLQPGVQPPTGQNYPPTVAPSLPPSIPGGVNP